MGCGASFPIGWNKQYERLAQTSLHLNTAFLIQKSVANGTWSIHDRMPQAAAAVPFDFSYNKRMYAFRSDSAAELSINAQLRRPRFRNFIFGKLLAGVPTSAAGPEGEGGLYWASQ